MFSLSLMVFNFAWIPRSERDGSRILPECDKRFQLLRPESLNRHLQFQLLSVSAQALYFVIWNKLLTKIDINWLSLVEINRPIVGIGTEEGFILWKRIPSSIFKVQRLTRPLFLVFDRSFRSRITYRSLFRTIWRLFDFGSFDEHQTSGFGAKFFN